MRVDVLVHMHFANHLPLLVRITITAFIMCPARVCAWMELRPAAARSACVRVYVCVRVYGRVCMRVCVCVCRYAPQLAHARRHTHVHTRTHTRSPYTHVHTRAHSPSHPFTHTHPHTLHMAGQMRAELSNRGDALVRMERGHVWRPSLPTHTHTHVHTHIHTRTHTYTHLHTTRTRTHTYTPTHTPFHPHPPTTTHPPPTHTKFIWLGRCRRRSQTWAMHSFAWSVAASGAPACPHTPTHPHTYTHVCTHTHMIPIHTRTHTYTPTHTPCRPPPPTTTHPPTPTHTAYIWLSSCGRSCQAGSTYSYAWRVVTSSAPACPTACGSPASRVNAPLTCVRSDGVTVAASFCSSVPQPSGATIQCPAISACPIGMHVLPNSALHAREGRMKPG